MIIEFLRIEKNLTIEIDKNSQFNLSFSGVVNTIENPMKKVKIKFSSILNRFQFNLLQEILNDPENKYFSIYCNFITHEDYEKFYHIFDCFYELNKKIYLFFVIDNIEVNDLSNNYCECTFSVYGVKYE